MGTELLPWKKRMNFDPSNRCSPLAVPTQINPLASWCRQFTWLEAKPMASSVLIRLKTEAAWGKAIVAISKQETTMIKRFIRLQNNQFLH
jgi:hypothetical protein